MSISKKFAQGLAEIGRRLGLLGLACVGLSLPLSTNAQKIENKQTRTLLQTRVHLRLGETTLVKALQEVSRQTGLQIQAADYLQDRELLVALNDLTAQAVLETLAESNDWVWYESKPGQILMTRPHTDHPQGLLEVAPAFRTVVPKDLRRFLGIDLSDAEFRTNFRQSLLDNAALRENPHIIELAPVRRSLLPRRLEAITNEQRRRMFPWVTEEVRQGKPILYTQLTSDKQQALLVHFILNAMYSVLNPENSGALDMVLGLDPAAVNEARMQVTYKNSAAFIGPAREGTFSFGEGIVSPEKFPDPLFLRTKP